MNQIDLGGRTAVITGGCRGIGLAIADRMAASGARIAIWDMDARALQELSTRRAAFSTSRVDVADEQQVQAAVKATVADLGRIDILVNAAGIAGTRVAVADCSLEEWKRVMSVNLDGTFLCCREVVRQMRDSGYGRIVNIATIAGKEGNAMASHYSAAKAAVIALTKSLGKEMIEHDIRVNAVAPAAVDTDLFSALPADRQKVALARIPMGRAGRTDEVAAMVAWIASAECSFTTGFTFDLSGGRATY